MPGTVWMNVHVVRDERQQQGAGGDEDGAARHDELGAEAGVQPSRHERHHREHAHQRQQGQSGGDRRLVEHLLEQLRQVERHGEEHPRCAQEGDAEAANSGTPITSPGTRALRPARRSTRTKATRATPKPASNPTMRASPQPSSVTSSRATRRATSETVRVTTPAMSTRSRASRSKGWWMYRHVASTATAATGRLTTNTHRHPKVSVSTPPTSGPRVADPGRADTRPPADAVLGAGARRRHAEDGRPHDRPADAHRGAAASRIGSAERGATPRTSRRSRRRRRQPAAPEHVHSRPPVTISTPT